MPVTVPVRVPTWTHGNTLVVNNPLTELPFWVNVAIPAPNVCSGDVGALAMVIVQVPVKFGGGEEGIAPPPQPAIKHSAMIPIRPRKAALTIEFLAIDFIIILLTFHKEETPERSRSRAWNA